MATRNTCYMSALLTLAMLAVVALAQMSLAGPAGADMPMIVATIQ